LMLIHFKHCRFNLTHAFMYLSCPNVLAKIIFEHANVRFSLEILA
jgi:hypothetical protein